MVHRVAQDMNEDIAEQVLGAISKEDAAGFDFDFRDLFVQILGQERQTAGRSWKTSRTSFNILWKKSV